MKILKLPSTEKKRGGMIQVYKFLNCVYDVTTTEGNQLKSTTVQRRATRSIPSLRKLAYYERMKILKLPSTEKKRGGMIQVYNS